MELKNIRLTQLDGMRGICALMVAVFHFANEHHFQGISLFSNFIITQADLFVDFFFVLSGFVISLNYTSIQHFGSFKHFLKKRFIRLYPLLFYTVMVFFAFELFFNILMPQLLNKPEPISTLVLFTADSLLFLNSTPLLGDTPGMNFPSWSISAEMISYIVFGLTLFCFSRYKKVALALILLISATVLFIYNSYMETYHLGFVRGILCFTTGFYTYILFKKYHASSISSIWAYALTLLTISIFFFRSSIANKELFTLFTIPPAFALLILCLALSRNGLSKLLSNKIFDWLGKRSYSIYLNHALLMILINKAAFKLFHLPSTPLVLYLVVLIYLAVLIIYSHLTFTWIENKGGKLLLSMGIFKSDTAAPEKSSSKAA